MNHGFMFYEAAIAQKVKHGHLDCVRTVPQQPMIVESAVRSHMDLELASVNGVYMGMEEWRLVFRSS